MTFSETRRFFGPDSPLQQAGSYGGPAYEPRPQQVAMAEAIARTLDEGGSLCVEAPTGVGKTFAYLVPAYYYACESEKAVVVTTHTINLQEQIIRRDLPLMEKILGKEIRYALAKGRSNYLCLRRLSHLADMDEEMLPGGRKILGNMGVLLDWAEKTRTGDRGELETTLSPKIWEMVCCERGNCLGGKCPFAKRCYLNRAKRNCQKAQIIIANHALFFSSLAMQQEAGGSENASAILPEYGAVIVDEGHMMEDTAAEHLGLRADSLVLRKILSRLYSEEHYSGLLNRPECESARKPVADLKRMLGLFIPRLIEWIDGQNAAQGVLRYTVPGHIENYLDHYCQALERELNRQILQFEESEPELVKELTSLRQAVHEQNQALNIFFSMGFKDYVYWFEVYGRERKDLVFNCLPVDVAPILQNRLFSVEPRIPVIITSATLAVNGNIDFFKQRIGCLSAGTLMLDSPFNYKEQVRVYLPDSMPEPREDAYQREVEKYVCRFLKQTGGCAFVLFTSYASMRLTAQHLELFFQENHLELLMQGEGLQPRKMLELFRSRKGAVIFGTDSFWTGVDVPGKALSNVIITKLPFAVPDYPLVAARGELIAARGGSAFAQYSLPEAVLKFRQGIGRLIRTSSDRGIIVILDGRIRTKFYGKVFLNSIPECPVELC